GSTPQLTPHRVGKYFTTSSTSRNRGHLGQLLQIQIQVKVGERQTNPTTEENIKFSRVLCAAEQNLHIEVHDAKPFTRSQARELRDLQGLFMKKEALEYIWEMSKGFHVWIVAWEEKGTQDDQRSEESG
ncbi:hypothetical protein HAX54_035716, partial [Datura stramonium]|nr:hypothetical protein [Datura stramonium]